MKHVPRFLCLAEEREKRRKEKYQAKSKKREENVSERLGVDEYTCVLGGHMFLL